MGEIWELYTACGERTGVYYERGSGREIPDGLYALGVEIWIKVGADKLLFTKRHPNKYMGLMWEAPGGGVLKGENGLMGAMRELAEETGISLPNESFIFLGSRRYEQIIAESYLVELESLPTLALQPSEVIDAKLVTDRDVEEMWDTLTPGTQERYQLYKERIFG